MRPGNKRFEHLEAFGHHQRRMVGQHHPPEPTRMLCVIAAICPIMMSGEALAMAGRL